VYQFGVFQGINTKLKPHKRKMFIIYKHKKKTIGFLWPSLAFSFLLIYLFFPKYLKIDVGGFARALKMEGMD